LPAAVDQAAQRVNGTANAYVDVDLWNEKQMQGSTTMMNQMLTKFVDDGGHVHRKIS